MWLVSIKMPSHQTKQIRIGREMDKIFLFAILILSISTAFANEKGVTVKTSGFDGAKEVYLKPYGSSSCLNMRQTCISVGAVWSSSATGQIGLELKALRELTMMRELLINIDGDIIKASRDVESQSTDIVNRYKESSQRFIITQDQFNKMLNAQKVWFKILKGDGTYIETYLIDNGKDTLAFKGLNRFSKHLH